MAWREIRAVYAVRFDLLSVGEAISPPIRGLLRGRKRVVFLASPSQSHCTRGYTCFRGHEVLGVSHHGTIRDLGLCSSSVQYGWRKRRRQLVASPHLSRHPAIVAVPQRDSAPYVQCPFPRVPFLCLRAMADARKWSALTTIEMAIAIAACGNEGDDDLSKRWPANRSL